nr:unnamed protein product [Digitaria exilis]
MCSLCYKKHHGSKESGAKPVPSVLQEGGVGSQVSCAAVPMREDVMQEAPEHGRAFDFKGAARDVIARANPRIKGEKLLGKI